MLRCPERSARFFPWVIGYPVLVMSVMHLAHSLWCGLRPPPPGRAPPAAAAAVAEGSLPAPGLVRRRTVEISAWAVLFALGLWLLGFKVGGLVMPLVFLRFQARETWGASLLYGFFV